MRNNFNRIVLGFLSLVVFFLFSSTALVNKVLAEVPVPSAPTDLTGIPGDAQVLLSWTGPTDEGSTIVDYQIEYGIGDSWTTMGHETPITEPSATVTGLINSVSYNFRVSAINQTGVGATSSPIAATPIAVPSVPIGLTAVTGDTQVILSWTGPTDEGSTIVDYQIEYKPSDVGDTGWIPQLVGTSATSVSGVGVTGLINETSYDFRVAAINQSGLGAYVYDYGVVLPVGPTSPPPTPTPTVSVPSAPTDLTGIPGDAQVLLSWTGPSDVGSTIVDYQIDYGIGDSWTTMGHGSSITDPTVTVTGLTNDISYNFRVSAINQTGIGATSSSIAVSPSASITPTPTVSVPSAPSNLLAVPDDTQVILSWTGPSDVGSSLIQYQIEYKTSDVGDTSWTTQVVDSSEINVSGVPVTDLTDGTSYDFRVAAVNQIGLGVYVYSYGVMPVADFTDLNTAIATAQSLHNSAVAGIGYGQYPAEAITNLQTAIDTATAVKNDLASGQTIIGLTVNALNYAVGVFQETRIIPTNIGATDLSALITYGTFTTTPDDENPAETSAISVGENVTINIGESGSLSTVYLPQGTTITEHNNQSFNLSELSATIIDKNTLSDPGSGFTKEAAIQWGIPNMTLLFSNPITINIYVGTDLNGRILNVLRSPSGSSGWTSDGIVSPATCVVSGGYCQFSATQASYFTPALYEAPVQQSSNSSNPPGPPVCNDTPPVDTPSLFEIKTIKGSVKLFYTPTTGTTAYAVMFGLKKGDERFGTIINTINENKGIQNADIYMLNPKTTYYFKVAAVNGCTMGPWSEWIPAKANRKSTIYAYKTVIKNKIKTLVSLFK